MVQTAIKNRWAVPEALKRKMMEKIEEAVDSKPDPYKLARLVDVAVAADRSDLARDEFEAKEKRLDAESPTEVQGIRVIIEGVDHGEGDA